MYKRYALMAAFCHKLSGALNHGLSIFQALPLLIDSEKNKVLKKQLIQLQKHLDDGEKLAPALIQLLGSTIPFQDNETAEIPDTHAFLVGCETFLKQRQSLTKLIKKQLSYPIILLISLLFLFILFLTTLLPMYMGFFTDLGQRPPAFMKALQDLRMLPSKNEGFLIICGLLFTALLFGLAFGAIQLKKHYARPFVAANQLKIITLMINCGFSFKEAITQIRFNSHKNAFDKLFLTGDIAAFFNETLSLSVYQFERICFALNSGTLINTLSELLLEIEESGHDRIIRLVTLAQPVMIFILGALIFTFVYFTFIPILDSIAVL